VQFWQFWQKVQKVQKVQLWQKVQFLQKWGALALHLRDPHRILPAATSSAVAQQERAGNVSDDPASKRAGSVNDGHPVAYAPGSFNHPARERRPQSALPPGMVILTGGVSRLSDSSRKLMKARTSRTCSRSAGG
jgi:hypothetical protein